MCVCCALLPHPKQARNSRAKVRNKKNLQQAGRILGTESTSGGFCFEIPIEQLFGQLINHNSSGAPQRHQVLRLADPFGKSPRPPVHPSWEFRKESGEAERDRRFFRLCFFFDATMCQLSRLRPSWVSPISTNKRSRRSLQNSETPPPHAFCDVDAL